MQATCPPNDINHGHNDRSWYLAYGSDKDQVQTLEHQSCNLQVRKEPQSSTHDQPAHDFGEVRRPWAAEGFASGATCSSDRRRDKDIDAWTGNRSTYSPPFLESETTTGCAWEFVESNEITHDPSISLYPWVSQLNTSSISTYM